MLKFIKWTPLIAVMATGAQAQQAPTVAIGSYFTNIPGSTITRPANTTPYSANVTVCNSTTVACIPGTIQIAASNGQNQFINRVTLLKSGATTTNATFTIWMFSAAPGLATPTQED